MYNKRSCGSFDDDTKLSYSDQLLTLNTKLQSTIQSIIDKQPKPEEPIFANVAKKAKK